MRPMPLLLLCLALTFTTLASASSSLPEDVDDFDVSPASTRDKQDVVDYLTFNNEEIGYAEGDDGGLSFLAGDNIAPSCETNILLTIENAATVVACFFDDQRTLLEKQGQDTTAVQWAVSRVRGASDGIVTIDFHQLFGDVKVLGSDASLVVVDGIVVQYTGGLFAPADVPDAAPWESELDEITQIENSMEVEDVLGVTVTESTRHFDVNTQAVMSVYSVDELPGEMVRFSETDGVVWDMENIAANAPHHHGAPVVNYGAPTTSPGASPPSRFEGAEGTDFPGRMMQSIPVNIDPIHITHDDRDDEVFCAHRLKDRASEKSGYPQMRYEKRIPSPNPNPTSETCRQDFPFTPRAGTDSLLNYNAYFWLRDLADFASSRDAAYSDWYAWDNPRKLVVDIDDDIICFGGAPACVIPYTSSSVMYIRKQYTPPPSGGPVELYGPNSLSLLAHEFGHYLQYQYTGIPNEYVWDDVQRLEPGAPYSQIDYKSVVEGFADHNVLRYAIYRHKNSGSGSLRPHDDYTLSGYHHVFPTHGSGSAQYKTIVQPDVEAIWYRGQRLMIRRGTAWPSLQPPNDRGVIFSKGSPACSGDYADPYKCGSIIPTVYWHLAWNTCQIGWMACDEGDPILDTSAYVNEPERLANVAFTYAINSTGRSGDIEEFMRAVQLRYYLFYRRDGFISRSEYSRVAAILASHCVGWRSWECSLGHKSPGSPLPRNRVDRARFDTVRTDSIVEHLLIADYDFLPARNRYYAGGQNREKALALWHASAARTKNPIHFPSAGSYRISGALASKGTTHAVLRLISADAPVSLDTSTAMPASMAGLPQGGLASGLNLSSTSTTRLLGDAMRAGFYPDSSAEVVGGMTSLAANPPPSPIEVDWVFQPEIASASILGRSGRRMSFFWEWDRGPIIHVPQAGDYYLDMRRTQSSDEGYVDNILIRKL